MVHTSGAIEDLTFLGAIPRLRVRLDEGAAGRRASFSERDQTVTVSFSRDDLIALDHQSRLNSHSPTILSACRDRTALRIQPWEDDAVFDRNAQKAANVGGHPEWIKSTVAALQDRPANGHKAQKAAGPRGLGERVKSTQSGRSRGARRSAGFVPFADLQLIPWTADLREELSFPIDFLRIPAGFVRESRAGATT